MPSPTPAQMAGFNVGRPGNGVTITGYEAPDNPRTSMPGGPHIAAGTSGDNGVFTLSNNRRVGASELIAQNQRNAFGQDVPARLRYMTFTPETFVGQEITAPARQGADKQVAPPPEPPKPEKAPSRPGRAGTSAAEPTPPTPKLQTFEEEAPSRSRRGRRLRSGGGGDTLITGGRGVLGGANTSGKQLFGE